MPGFPADYRLREAGQFRDVFSGQPMSVADHYFRLLAIINDQGHARLGLAITKKSIRKAYQRNRLKRLIREAFRARLGVRNINLNHAAQAHDALASQALAGQALASQALASQALASQALDIVVMARPAAASATNRALHGALDALLDELLKSSCNNTNTRHASTALLPIAR